MPTRINRELVVAARRLLDALDELEPLRVLETAHSFAEDGVKKAADIARRVGPSMPLEEKRSIVTLMIESMLASLAANPAMYGRVSQAAEALRAVLSRVEKKSSSNT